MNSTGEKMATSDIPVGSEVAVCGSADVEPCVLVRLKPDGTICVESGDAVHLWLASHKAHLVVSLGDGMIPPKILPKPERTAIGCLIAQGTAA